MLPAATECWTTDSFFKTSMVPSSMAIEISIVVDGGNGEGDIGGERGEYDNCESGCSLPVL